MEAIKGIILDHGEVHADNSKDKTKTYKYVVGLILITDTKIPNTIPNGETLIMGANGFHNNLTEALKGFKLYRAPHNMGDVSDALLSVGHISPEDLEEIQPS